MCRGFRLRKSCSGSSVMLLSSLRKHCLAHLVLDYSKVADAVEVAEN